MCQRTEHHFVANCNIKQKTDSGIPISHPPTKHSCSTPTLPTNQRRDPFQPWGHSLQGQAHIHSRMEGGTAPKQIRRRREGCEQWTQPSVTATGQMFLFLFFIFRAALWLRSSEIGTGEKVYNRLRPCQWWCLAHCQASINSSVIWFRRGRLSRGKFPSSC